ncbi:hypothetical protein Glove_499g37 [Diversispora epigaea]|uniref:Uncharacterized protein n=1 Tax=Diversispora epigaea TaxID=1348612 RepID=A0A397GLJ2_9GLOM|nr:hypothetical protein Glove_499g37 [Diversispora epigaea]
MSIELYNKIYKFLITAEDKKINAISVVYLGMKEDRWIEQNELRTVVNRAVDSASNRYMEDSERQLGIFQILLQFDNAFEGVYGLYDMGAIKTDKEQLFTSDYTCHQIRKNISEVKRKFGKDTLPLYQHLYSGVNKISVQELTWKDSLANQIIRDNSDLIQKLSGNLKKTFMNLSSLPYKLSHTKEWKESKDKLEEITLKILETLRSVWRNPAFHSKFVGTINEGTYVNNIIVPLINAYLSNNHFGESAFITTFEQQSIASTNKRGDERYTCQLSQGQISFDDIYNGRVGRRPNIMFISKEDDKYYELIYAECSKIICMKQKEEDDDIKLWRTCNDGLYWAQKSHRLKKEQFGIIGIQIAGCRLSLNVLIRNEFEVHRYYKLHETEILIRYSNDPSILADFIYTLLLFRNTLIVNMSLLRCTHDRRSNRNLDKEQISKLVAENDKLKWENAEFLAKKTEFIARIAELKRSAKENVENANLKDAELNARISNLELYLDK